MKRIRRLAGLLAGILTISALPLSSASAEESGVVINGDTAQYIQDGVVLTGKICITPEILVGDTDTSGNLDALDAAVLLKAAAESASTGTPVGECLLPFGACQTAEEAFSYADCNLDGAADAVDAAVLLMQIAELGAAMETRPLGYAMYYADAEGFLQTGWIAAEDALYYAGENYMLTVGWLDADGQRFYFDKDGEALRSQLSVIGGKTYYFQENGVMLCSGWQEAEGKRYYFGADGIAVTGMHWIDGSLYAFDVSGVIQTGWLTASGSTYYFGENGAAICSNWLEYEGNHYYFNAEGQMRIGMATIAENRYYFDENGVMQTGFIDYKDNLYYFGEDGIAVTGWQDIDGDTYYFRKSNYTAVKGIGTISGVKYYFLPETGILYKNGTHGGVTTDENGAVLKVLLDTLYISQIGYPTGCESASAVMLLRDAGYDITIDTFIDEALDIGWLSWENGKLYGPHPSEAFIGDPRSSSGYGCYAPVILEALGDILTDGDTALDLTGTDLDTLCSRYIDRGKPVAVWATINMVESTPGTQWTIRSTGESFTWKRSEHCLVLVGYDADYYYLNDPYKGNGLMAYDRDVFEDRFEYMGSQSVVIVEAE